MKRYFYFSFILLSIFIFLIFSSCKKDEPTAPQNHLPKIGSLTANPTTVLVSTETTITCIATDEDGDNLTISWNVKRGSFKNGSVGVAVIWVAPSTAGKDTITATVNDGNQTVQGKLEIIVGTLPTAPTLNAPANNAIEVPLSPTFTWNAINNADSYTLQVSSSSSFNSFVYNQNGLTNTSQQISGLNIATTYYWRVNSKNIYGTSTWTTFSFRTVTPPQTPTLLSPTTYAYGISLSPTLTWSAVSNASSYTLQVSADDSFSNFVYNQNGLTNTSQQLSGLSSFTTYYWKVSATNNYGTSVFSNVLAFATVSTPCSGLATITYLGKAYNTVQIGTQCWLKENLDVGIMITTILNQTNNGVIEKYCYNNDPNKCATYGGLYQWNEAMQYINTEKAQGICPNGWHIPTRIEFQTLATTVYNYANSLKAIGQGNSPGTDASGFSALLAGSYAQGNGFVNLGGDTYFLSSTFYNYNISITLAYILQVNGFDSGVSTNSGTSMEFGLSVRCIKD